MRKKYVQLIKKRVREPGLFLWIKRHVINALGVPVETFTGHSFGGPLLGTLMLTYRCNQACAYCDLPDRSRKFKEREYTTQQFKDIMNDMAAFNVGNIVITGGEPLLRPDVYEIISYAKSRGFGTQMTTNGLLLNEKNCDLLIACGLDDLAVSFEGRNPDAHDAIRGLKGAFHKTHEGLERLLELCRKRNSGLHVTLSTTISNQNIDEIVYLVDYCRELRINISVGVVNTNFECQRDLRIFEQDGDNNYPIKWDRVMDYLISESKKSDSPVDNSSSYLKRMKYLKKEGIHFQCFAGYHSIYVDCYGNIFSCWHHVEEGKKAGTIDQYGSLLNYWKSKERQARQKELRLCQDCFFVCQMEPNEFYYVFKETQLKKNS